MLQEVPFTALSMLLFSRMVMAVVAVEEEDAAAARYGVALVLARVVVSLVAV